MHAREECVVRARASARAGERVRIEGARASRIIHGSGAFSHSLLHCATPRIAGGVSDTMRGHGAGMPLVRLSAVNLLRVFARCIVARPSRSQT